MTAAPSITVIRVSPSFEAFWSDLAGELECTVDLLDPGQTPAATAAMVFVAAGGQEHDGLDVLDGLDIGPHQPVYSIGAAPSHRFAVEAMRRGAMDYFALPDDVELLRRTAAAALERGRHAAPTSVTDAAFRRLRGESEALRETLAKALRIAGHGQVTVLIGGETGTGKELLAHAIHEAGPRAAGPFVPINCAAIPANLLESELFGHVRGAFTDARDARAGLFEEADGGTLFLDEIGHLTLELQAKLLRVLEDRTVRRVGSNTSREIDVRIVAATHVDLRAAVAQGTFREDLYYRLNVITLELPPLRERGRDIELLAGVFAEELAERYGVPVPRITGALVAALHSHTWPGNVRELRHAIERALLLSPPGTIDPDELAVTERAATRAGSGTLPFPASIEEITVAATVEMVRLLGGNKSAAARRLGISRPRLLRLLERARDSAIPLTETSDDGAA